MVIFISALIKRLGDLVAQQVEHLTFNQGVAGSNPARVTSNGARVAELADALDLESSGAKPPVRVQIPPLAPRGKIIIGRV